MYAAEDSTITEGTELVLVRHGETVWNTQGRIQGTGDSPLTENGVAQAEALAWRLHRSGRCPITACYASPLGRAHHTAQILTSNGLALPVTLEPDLAERNYGVLEGLSPEEKLARFPEVVAEDEAGGEDYAPPGGESRAMVRTRALRALAKIASRHPGERILIVTHGAVLGIVARSVWGIPRANTGAFSVPNTALNLFRWRNKRWQITAWGDTGEFCVGSGHGYWVVDVAAALRLIGVGVMLGAVASLGAAGLLVRRRR